ncbi:MAG: hypothetical protein ACFCU8_14160 [Thermosynechococcaceae cyanobacterium]
MSAAPRLLYEQSGVHRGYLIIPFLYGTVTGVTLYSYRLLSLVSSQALLHRAENPCDRIAEDPLSMVAIAKAHLDEQLAEEKTPDYCQQHYVYRHNLIIISAIGDKVFYDHYPPSGLNNIAAPKLFASEQECIEWVKQGLDRPSSD